MTDARESKSHTALWFTLLALTPVLYVLSCGPVVELTEDASLPRRWPDWVFTLYKPLEWLHRNENFSDWLVRYHDWWKEHL